MVSPPYRHWSAVFYWLATTRISRQGPALAARRVLDEADRIATRVRHKRDRSHSRDFRRSRQDATACGSCAVEACVEVVHGHRGLDTDGRNAGNELTSLLDGHSESAWQGRSMEAGRTPHLELPTARRLVERACSLDVVGVDRDVFDLDIP
jgi:hypothetical protein